MLPPLQGGGAGGGLPPHIWRLKKAAPPKVAPPDLKISTNSKKLPPPPSLTSWSGPNRLKNDKKMHLWTVKVEKNFACGALEVRKPSKSVYLAVFHPQIWARAPKLPPPPTFGGWKKLPPHISGPTKTLVRCSTEESFSRCLVSLRVVLVSYPF